MRISCGVIQDLLPLYADERASFDSVALVREHLAGCEACSARLESMRSKQKAQSEPHLTSRQRAMRSRQKKWLPWVAAGCAVLMVLCLMKAMLLQPVWLDADEAVVSVEEVEHGGVRFVLKDYVTGHSMTRWEGNVGHVWSTTRLDKLLSGFGYRLEDNKLVEAAQQEFISRGVILGENGAVKAYTPELADVYGVTEQMTELNHWYENVYSGTLDMQLWDGGQDIPEEDVIEKENLLILSFAASLFLAAALPIGAKKLKKFKYRGLLNYAALLALSIAVSTVVVTGFRFVRVCVGEEPYDTAKWIYLIGCTGWACAVSLWRLHRIGKRV